MNTRCYRQAVTCFVTITLLATFVAGCGGPETADVSGRITLKGVPPNMEGLTISFMGADGKPSTVLIAADGSYKATGVAVGEMKVGFSDTNDSPFMKGPKVGEKKGNGGQKDNAKRKVGPTLADSQTSKASVIPRKYSDPLKSGVSTTLNPGPNTFDFDIK